MLDEAQWRTCEREHQSRVDAAIRQLAHGHPLRRGDDALVAATGDALASAAALVPPHGFGIERLAVWRHAGAFEARDAQRGAASRWNRRGIE